MLFVEKTEYYKFRIKYLFQSSFIVKYQEHVDTIRYDSEECRSIHLLSINTETLS